MTISATIRYSTYRLISLSSLLLVLSSSANAQVDFNRPDRGVAQFNVKAGGYKILKGGYGFSAAIGFWAKFNRLQPACNLSFNFVGGKANLGNRNRYLTNWQINTILTPMLTFGWGDDGAYQEINPFYFGSLGAVYAFYRSSITLGSNFVVMPRAVGRNVTTYRNRTQQLIYLGIRAGTNDWDVNINVYEDFFGTDNAILQGLADNYDRFYTGGFNVQLRYQKVKAKFYSDTYTGNFPRDLFDAPDLYIPYQNAAGEFDCKLIGSQVRQRHPRYVAQEPGQKLFNTGRNFLVLEVMPPNPTYNLSYQLYAGWQGGHAQMAVQNWIHGLSISTIDKINPRFKPNDLHHDKPKREQERLHRFYPAYDKGSFIFGAGILSNTLNRQKP